MIQWFILCGVMAKPLATQAAQTAPTLAVKAGDAAGIKQQAETTAAASTQPSDAEQEEDIYLHRVRSE